MNAFDWLVASLRFELEARLLHEELLTALDWGQVQRVREVEYQLACHFTSEFEVPDLLTFLGACGTCGEPLAWHPNHELDSTCFDHLPPWPDQPAEASSSFILNAGALS